MNEEEKCKFEIEIDHKSKIKSSEDDYQFLKTEKLETNLECINIFKCNEIEQLNSQNKNNMQDGSILKIKQQENITSYVSNELLTICKSEKVIIDIDNDLQQKTLDSNQEYLNLLQTHILHVPVDTQRKKKKRSQHESANGNNIFICAKCTYKSESRRNFIGHLRVHFVSEQRKYDSTKFKCTHCYYSTGRKHSLIKHLRTHGVYEVESVFCTYCKTGFKNKYNLARHLSKGHSEKARPLKCSICTVSYGSPYSLKRHLLTHSEELPYKCVHCDYATARRYGLVKHLSTHERNSQTKSKAVCEVCSKQFNSNFRLKNHLKIQCKKENDQNSRAPGNKTVKDSKSHTVQLENKYPFKCDTCGFSASKHSFLKYHIVRRHTGEAVFSCSSCDYSTSRPEHLQNHKRIKKHDVLSCEHCKYTCFKYYNMQKHMKTHFKY